MATGPAGRGWWSRQRGGAPEPLFDLPRKIFYNAT
jgi:hypothetical protein